MLDSLVLLRLLAVPDGARGEVRSRVAADLRPYATGAEFAAAVARLAQAGHLLAGGRGGARLQLTEAGRAEVHGAFDVPAGAPPGRHGWAWWRDRYAVPRALGVRHADTAGALRVALLRRCYLPELPAGAPAGGLLATVDLLLAKRLRTPQASPNAFRAAALREWVAGGPGEPPAPVPAVAPGAARLPGDLPAFAARVRAAAQRGVTGRFGDRKVFISHVWNELLAAGHAAPDEEPLFKERLVQANTAGLLRLSRADLAGAHDVQDVRASETPYLGEIFHFLRLD